MSVDTTDTPLPPPLVGRCARGSYLLECSAIFLILFAKVLKLDKDTHPLLELFYPYTLDVVGIPLWINMIGQAHQGFYEQLTVLECLLGSFLPPLISNNLHLWLV